MAFLLSSRAIFDLSLNPSSASRRWFDEVSGQGISRTIFVSAVARQNVIRSFDTQLEVLRGSKDPNAIAFHRARENALTFFSALNPSRQFVSFEPSMASVWDVLLATKLDASMNDKTELIGSSEKLELATAIEGRAGKPFRYVVDRQRPVYALIDGLDVLDPDLYQAAKT